MAHSRRGDIVGKEIYTCVCTKTVIFNNPYDDGFRPAIRFAEATGWFVIIDYDGKEIYMCPGCFEDTKAKLDEKLCKVAGDAKENCTDFLFMPNKDGNRRRECD